MNLTKFVKTVISTQRFFSRSSFNVVQASYLDEECIEVNRFDKVLGKISKEDCHRNCKFFLNTFHETNNFYFIFRFII